MPLSILNLFILERPIDPGDTQIAHYLIATWGQVMGPEFQLYLPVVITVDGECESHS